MIPQTTEALLSRAQSIAGLTFGELAAQWHTSVPPNLKRDKGWVGMLLETALGATAGSKAEQDFSQLGIELKTLPINEQGYPLETTFVSLAPLIQNSGVNWQNSHVRHKLSCVLWIPIEGSRHIPLAERHIGAPILWQPDERQEALLKRDWEELMDYIVLGQLDKINARLGEVLQLRPKAANSKALTKGIGKNGEIIYTLPLGFYLRKEFTYQILQQFVQQAI
ncbi:DNA mismatch repair protein [Aggregatibacter actinomycetemcomitans serotype e str. SC1083]|uniref:DNA mismatch repair protein MutH n=1 Tax=Aggregatibacter actinomycetemcomitans serotype e str. SC1083 TaxID=907488 RepID=G4A6I7_AGGAC|nr:DNA mismatch repair endonuclease MutH [Aggregatibacter actinomycetemcomitans]EGY34724.1 DNA mismatch repair protein [Aggregatibacter actinomycetemcomitans serotype e str. SC1083]KYK74259.1 DNA mismatch repair protein MutH [Aggregatibacter actinomycetemcomitans serotype e str. SA3096]KYK80635.1 DNA mismatch repair protein MutH [Aggregatibacter actinomycetemcomitans serotype e str. SC936]KYK96212.1 DNA mismatch repair protein MutH [Aggregatibacter actinomycetemcomitans serotype e str. ANH9776]